MSLPPAAGSLRVGCAGWSIPAAAAERLPGGGAHLARYARVLTAAEINSSFHRPHRPATYARWAATVPPGFRFSVKLPKEVTHVRRLVDAEEPLERFLAESDALGARRGPLLVQLPPSLAFDADTAAAFLGSLRRRYVGPVACEPRHPSWFAPAVDELLAAARVARVAADPPPVPDAAHPGGWDGLVYRRLHGSPQTYRSPYDAAALDALAAALAEDAARGADCWCIFDNTASGAALPNALDLRRRLVASRGR